MIGIALGLLGASLLLRVVGGTGAARWMRVLSVVLALAGILLAGVRMLRGAPAHDARETLPFHSAAGHELGRQIAREVPPPASILLLPGLIANEMDRATTEAWREGLRVGLGATGYEITMVREPSPDAEALADEEVMIAMARVDATRLRGYVREHPETKAIVSLVGVPARLNGSNGLPPLFVAGVSEDAELDDLLRRGVVRAAVITLDRLDPTAMPSRKMTPEAVFNLRYRMLTCCD
ncbi:MAG TPA: hypothetical protein PKE12_13615 [Kiritimatiellia bacterium]|nr:hypothetical protein [Kiritimatiellia bacterium]